MKDLVTQDYIIHQIREILAIDEKFPDNFVATNLLYFFIQNEANSAQWIKVIEQHWNIKITDHQIDFFFFSDLELMVEVITNHVNQSSSTSL